MHRAMYEFAGIIKEPLKELIFREKGSNQLVDKTRTVEDFRGKIIHVTKVGIYEAASTISSTFSLVLLLLFMFQVQHHLSPAVSQRVEDPGDQQEQESRATARDKESGRSFMFNNGFMTIIRRCIN